MYPSKTLGLCSVLLATSLASQLGLAKPLGETISEALEQHPVQVRAVERHAAAEETVRFEEAGYYPTADLTLGYGIERVYEGSNTGHFARREAQISISQMLYDGYATKSRVESSDSQAQAEYARIYEQAEAIAFEVATTYLDVLRQRELLVSTEENLAAHQDTYDKIKRRADLGVGSEADLNQARGRLALAQYNLTVVEGNLAEAEINFERVVGYKPDDLVMPNHDCCDLLPATPEEAKFLALAENPRFKAAIANHESSLSDVHLAQSAMHPRLDLEIDASIEKGVDGQDLRETTQTAMVRLRHNFYRGGSDQAGIERAERLSEQVRAQGEKDARDLKAEAELAWYGLEVLYRTLPELERAATEARGTRDSYSSQFTIGQRSLLDLLDSENELFTANNNLIEGTIDEQLARYELLYRVGRLLTFFELAPPEHQEHRNDQGELVSETEEVESPAAG